MLKNKKMMHFAIDLDLSKWLLEEAKYQRTTPSALVRLLLVKEMGKSKIK